MKLCNKDKNKGKFQSLETLQRKEMIMIFQASLIIKRPYKIFLLTFILFEYVNGGKHIHQHASKIK